MPEPTSAYRLPDGTVVHWTAEQLTAYLVDYQIALEPVTPEQWEAGYQRLMEDMRRDEHAWCRIVNPQASYEMGIARAQATKCYLPRVEAE